MASIAGSPTALRAVDAKGDEALESDLLQAHARRDHATLCQLYLSAAEARLAAGEQDAAAFFFTQAYVIALDGGGEEVARAAHSRLMQLGRDT